jgi:hypothetical protein
MEFSELIAARYSVRAYRPKVVQERLGHSDISLLRILHFPRKLADG